MEYALRALFFDLWLPSQFLQGKLIIKWAALVMFGFSVDVGGVADPAHGISRSRSATQGVRCRLFLNLCGRSAFDQGGTPEIPNFLSAAMKPFAVY